MSKLKTTQFCRREFKFFFVRVVEFIEQTTFTEEKYDNNKFDNTLTFPAKFNKINLKNFIMASQEQSSHKKADKSDFLSKYHMISIKLKK